jgi:hypothetical protein
LALGKLLQKPQNVSKHTGLSGNCRVLLPSPKDKKDKEQMNEGDDLRLIDSNDLYLWDIFDVANKLGWRYFVEKRFDETLKTVVAKMRTEGVNLDLFTIYCFRAASNTIFVSGGQRRLLSFVFSLFSAESKL